MIQDSLPLLGPTSLVRNKCKQEYDRRPLLNFGNNVEPAAKAIAAHHQNPKPYHLWSKLFLIIG